MAIKRKSKPKAKAKAKVKARKIVAKRKTAVRKAPARKAPARKAPARKVLPRKPQVAAKPKPAPAPAEERLGVVTHYYNHLGVAIVKLESGTLRVGDTVHIKGHTSDFVQPVESLQIEHAPVSEVHAGQEFGLKVKEHARERDVVFRAAPG